MTPLEQCVKQLRSLIAHPTVNPGGDEVTLCETLAGQLRELGADEVTVSTVDRADASPGAYVYACFGPPTLLLNVHLDTVPANSGWQRDPFVGEATEDRIYGLGSCDIKGAIACILTALRNTEPGGLGVLFSGDEENGSRCVPHFIANTDASSIRQAIVCEPTARCAGLRHRGVLAYRARYVGKGGHSSKADYMEKPMVELAKLALKLDAMAQSDLDLGPPDMRGLCMNVANFTGGVAYNVVPDIGELAFSLRPAPGFDQEDFERRLETARLESHSKIEIEQLTDHRPFACGDDVRIRDLVGAYTEEFVGLDFWTEAALLQAAGIDAVVIGPGDIRQAHCADEYVLIDDLAWALEMFTGIITRHAS
ncbi:MAG: M20 family metallopeptidase [Myxococcales bacterium]|nr:M20 family metallopeptidase [Myxococcales bacterium]